MQIIFGRQFLIPHWYLFSLLFSTILFYIISNIVKNSFLFSIQLLGISSYIIQYSRYYKFLDRYKDNVRLPLIDTLSILPLFVNGLTLASSKIVDILTINRTKSLVLLCLFIYFLFRYDIFTNIGTYSGIIHIFVSSSLFFAFYLLPINNFYLCFQNLIKQITSYTNGIYCLHTKIRIFINLDGTLKSIIKLYLLSYFISFIGTKISIKNKLKYLFI